MRRSATIICLALAALVALAAPAVASARTAKRPKVTRVSPMRLHVGDTLVIRGRNFSSHRRRDTVIFYAPSGRSAFVKPRRATRRRLVLVVPAAVGRIVSSGRATRVKLRVLAGRFSRWTPQRLSPVVVGAAALGGGSSPAPTTAGGGGGTTSGGGGGGGGSTGGSPPPSCTSGDYDGDLLSAAQEAAIGTDPCRADTDGDGIPDGYEEQSAIDLNHYPGSPPQPYPGARPYPNALDPGDANKDYDGDGLTLRDEYLMWLRFSADGVRRVGPPTTLSNLLYSDGLKTSVNPAPAAPAAGTLARWALDLNGNGVLSDDERDADGDGLGNWDEAHGRMTEAWWPAEHDGKIEPKESKYPDMNFLDNADLPGRDAFTVSDMDGDGVPDGQDDTDHDGLTNQFELSRPSDWQADAITGFPAGVNPWAYTNPFNPCKPFNSDRCHTHPPFGYYESDEVPPIGPDVPAGYPGTHPTTPDG